MVAINRGRWTAEIEGDFVVFLIGARFNRKSRIVSSLKDLSSTRGPAMKKMLDYLVEHPEKGLLGYEQHGMLTVQYWRSFEDLERFAKDEDDPHLEAWRTYWKRVGKSEDRTGIWHETYLVRSGEYEAMYGNMPTRGLAKASAAVPLAESSMARQRLKAGARS
jgi:fumigallin biosynthesis monooxygenase-like protein